MIKKILFLFPIILIFLFFYLNLKSSSKIEQKITNTIEKIEDIKDKVAPQPTKILPDGYPNKYLIKTAFVPQSPEKNWDQPWQDACEEAALLTVYYFYQLITPDTQTIKNDLQKMINFENQQSFSHDMNLNQMTYISQNYFNYISKIIDNPTIDIIKSYLIQNIPVIVPANGKILYKENKHFKSGGPYYHNLVILGFNEDKKQFITHDVGTQFGAYFKYSYSTLLESIHDFPTSGKKEDINDGDKKILVLLK